MARSICRLLLVLALGVALAVLPGAAAATVTGGCEVIGTSTSGGRADLTTADAWHLRSTDRVSVSAGAPFEQTEAAAELYAFGFAVPVAAGSSEGERAFHSNEYDAATLAFLGRVLVLAGSSSGPFHECAGRLTVVIDDANPFLSVLGGGGLAATLAGLLGMAWAVMKATSDRRRAIGLLALALFGAGLSLVLQQTSTPGEGAGPDVSAWVNSVAGPLDVSLDAAVLAQSAALTLFVVLLMPFPSILFNKTLEANLAEVRAALRRIPLAGRFVAPQEEPGSGGSPEAGWYHPLAIAAFIVASALLYGFLDPGFGRDAASLMTFLGIAAALVGVRWIGGLPKRAIMGSLTGDRGRMRAVPWTIFIAAACVLVSRSVDFLPGYLYGLVLGYTFARRLEQPLDGRVGAAGGWWMLAIAVVAWFCLGAMRTPGIEPSLPGGIAASVFGGLVVGGIQSVVFGYVPIRFLAGETVFRWNRAQWGAVYAVGLFAFFWIILDPEHGFVSATPQSSLVTTLALFAGFGLASVLFWAYFRFRRRPLRAAEPPV